METQARSETRKKIHFLVEGIFIFFVTLRLLQCEV